MAGEFSTLLSGLLGPAAGALKPNVGEVVVVVAVADVIMTVGLGEAEVVVRVAGFVGVASTAVGCNASGGS